MIRSLLVKVMLVSAAFTHTVCVAQSLGIKDANRILILGDSITHAGHYIVDLEVAVRTEKASAVPKFINLGLPSETCCGLSEPGHPFPRPNVHSRLDDALAKTKPDVVVACYGMNDGIYHPFSEKRFAAYQNGIRKLVEKAHAAGAAVVLLTPPPFDPVPLQGQPGKLLPAGSEGYGWTAVSDDYGQVIRQYAEWIMENSVAADQVIDIHTPMVSFLARKRETNPMYFFAADGVHLNTEGHQVMAQAILDQWGIPHSNAAAPEVRELVRQKERLLHSAWLSEVGHKRPGMKPGLPINEALQKARAIETKLMQMQ